MKEHETFENEGARNMGPIGGGVGENSEDIPGIGQYDDFQTIDWQRDLARDRMHHRYITKHKGDSFLSALKAAHDAWSGWVCVLLGKLKFLLSYRFTILRRFFNATGYALRCFYTLDICLGMSVEMVLVEFSRFLLYLSDM